MRDAAVKRQRNRCFYCGGAMLTPPKGRPRHHPDDATLEHLLPLAHGGTWRRENLRAAHRRCNEQRARELEAALLKLRHA